LAVSSVALSDNARVELRAAPTVVAKVEWMVVSKAPCSVACWAAWSAGMLGFDYIWIMSKFEPKI
jgi:hypothetical protein